MKKQKYYTIYEYDKETNDVKNVAEFTTREETARYLECGVNNLTFYCTKSLEEKPKKLKDLKYFFMIEKDF